MYEYLHEMIKVIYLPYLDYCAALDYISLLLLRRSDALWMENYLLSGVNLVFVV
jgi:hypothetical protein